MLSYFDRIARDMLFLHGHVTRVSDVTKDEATQVAASVEPPKPRRPNARRMACLAAACAVVAPLRYVSGQLR